ncbi:type II toxin-antitoxin system PemK/MazF family toxin [Sphingomonas adhaesiva]
MIVAPLTSGSHPARFRMPVSFRGKDGLVLPDQIRTLDRRRLVKRLGALDGPTLSGVLGILTEMFTI